MRLFSSTIALLGLSLAALAQPPSPAGPQAQPIILVGGTAHIGNGQVIPNAVIVMENGKITSVAPVGSSNVNQTGTEVIDISGKHVYPGVIAPNTTLGLQEVGAVRATRDYQETGDLNPNVRALIAYNTDSELVPTVRANGVLISQITPMGGTISGSSSVVQLDAWNWEDAAYRTDDGIHLNWPSMFQQSGWWAEPGATKKNDKREETLRSLETLFADARAYSAVKTHTPANLILESMRGLFDGRRNLYVHADFSKEIIESIQFAKKHGVTNVVIVGGEDALMAVDILKEHNVPVLLTSLHRLPGRQDEDVDLPFKLPYLLSQAGITVGLSRDGEPMQVRNLPFLAGTAAAHGLTKEEALKLITANNARILGIDQRVGTLEPGKDATLVVSEGDLLDMRTNDVTHAFIQGRKLILDDKHKRLYKRFVDKYNVQGAATN
jgi:imidazolonepropionase-like amidohydrolase